jgi:hypothetical protein
MTAGPRWHQLRWLAAFAFSVLLFNQDAWSTDAPSVKIDGQIIPLEPAFEDYAFMLEDACKAMELDGDNCLIFSMMGDIKFNAMATIVDGNKVIIYDRRLSTVVGGDGAQAIIAHELGHHYCGHLRKPPNAMHELEADQFAGAVMRKLGFSLETAKSYALLLSKQPSATHPDRATREKAIEMGWKDVAAAKQCKKSP